MPPPPGAVLDVGGSSEHGRQKPCFPVTCVVVEGATEDLCAVEWDQCLGKVKQEGDREHWG